MVPKPLSRRRLRLALYHVASKSRGNLFRLLRVSPIIPLVLPGRDDTGRRRCVGDIGRCFSGRRGHSQQDQEKRRFRVRECGDLSTHREPLNRTRRSVCKQDHTCPEGEETGHQRMKPESRRRSPNQTPSAGIRPWAVFQRGSAHEPPPDNVASARDVARSAAARRGWDAGPTAGACVASTPLNRPCAHVCGCGVEV